MKFAVLCLLTFIGCAEASSILNTPAIDASAFRVTQFATGLPLPNSVIKAKDGSILALTSDGFFGNTRVVRLQDSNFDGVADGPAQTLYTGAGTGVGTQIRQADKLVYIGEFGSSSITALSPGASASDPLTSLGSLQFQYPAGHAHPTAGIAVRQTPGSPGSVDLVFNIGSQFNNQLSTDKVTVSGFGLAPTALDGDSLYMVTINESGASPIASNLRQIATGIRNVYGMAFHPVSGDLYFADNAIDEDNPTNFTQPLQADELNRIPSADLGVNILRFGYPNCYDAYRTYLPVGGPACTGVTDSLINFQPVPNTLSGFRSEGPTEIAFSPSLFPNLYRNGIFVGFSGGTGPNGTNDQNPLVFVNSAFDSLTHFIESGTIGNILGVYATDDSLFISDWGGTNIYQITAINPVPEPSTFGLIAIALALGFRFSARR
ncbi:MAG: PEP-CTERM sorting domain-containing protein [Acidobacteria bacterium]|nr:PEP-CTERM sorting domain-containing protein [Acidobacteriota bacterium]